MIFHLMQESSLKQKRHVENTIVHPGKYCHLVLDEVIKQLVSGLEDQNEKTDKGY